MNEFELPSFDGWVNESQGEKTNERVEKVRERPEDIQKRTIKGKKVWKDEKKAKKNDIFLHTILKDFLKNKIYFPIIVRLLDLTLPIILLSSVIIAITEVFWS